MGVMSCSRFDCTSVMCDTHINGVGYVCRGCQEEFKEYLKKENIQATTDSEYTEALKKFMDTSKDRYTAGNEMSVDDFFRHNTN